MLLLADDVIEFTPIMVVGVIGFVFVVSILSRTVTRIVIARSREATRREVAAYVAVGTIEPDHAVALLNAGESADDDTGRGCC